VATDGDNYELTMGRWSQLLAPLFLDFVGLEGVESLLDVGCGTGHLAAAASRRLPSAKIFAADLSPVYIEHAKARYPDPRIAFRVDDACALSYPDQSFDRVLSMLVLHFVPRTFDALAEMRRVTKSGAIVGAAVWDARGGFVAGRLFFDTAAMLDAKAAELRARSYTRPMTRPGELAAAWRTAGFRDVSETSLQIRMEFESFADYWAPHVGTEGPIAEYVTSLPEEERQRLETAVRAAYLDGEPDGPRSYAALAWSVKGVAP
jgi:ubiquinone/menaquinone biosynthesis C-methylase UbiE